MRLRPRSVTKRGTEEATQWRAITLSPLRHEDIIEQEMNELEAEVFTRPVRVVPSFEPSKSCTSPACGNANIEFMS
jgi:hypothetical protein